jgi:phosphogluconate dehydratase
LAKVRDGDIIRLCAHRGELSLAPEPPDWAARRPATAKASPLGHGRELFAFMRASVDGAEAGASAMLGAMDRITQPAREPVA